MLTLEFTQMLNGSAIVKLVPVQFLPLIPDEYLVYLNVLISITGKVINLAGKEM